MKKKSKKIVKKKAPKKTSARASKKVSKGKATAPPMDLEYLKTHIDKIWEQVSEANDRLQDLEIQSNLITRLLTTICLEYLEMKEEDFSALIRRIEEEAVEDSQILHLEHLFSLEPEKNKSKRKRKKKDPPEDQESA